MNQEQKIEQLNQRVEELEYRLAILESFVDNEGILHGKNDDSKLNAMKIAVKNDLKNKGYSVHEFLDRLGKKFYVKK